MKTTDFRKIPTSAQLKENINKQFGVNVNLNRYSREQLEDMRNKLRTRVSQQEGRAGINDLLTNETYQKDKAMLALLNTRIKEMLGEDIKKLRDKMDELSEAKKGVRTPKHTKKSKGTADTEQAPKKQVAEISDQLAQRAYNARIDRYQDAKAARAAADKDSAAKANTADIFGTSDKKERADAAKAAAAQAFKSQDAAAGKVGKSASLNIKRNWKQKMAAHQAGDHEKMASLDKDYATLAGHDKFKEGKAAKANKDYDGDGKIESPKDEVWGSRAKAAAKSGKPFGKKDEAVKEEWPDPKKIAASTTGKFEKKKVGTGTVHSRKADTKDSDDDKKGSQGASIPTSTETGKYGSAADRETMAQHKAGKSKISGRVVKGKAQSGPQPDDHTDESIAEEKPSAGMTKKEKSAVVKKAKAGKDIGKPGKTFKDVAAKAAKKYGSKERGEAAAASVMWKKEAAKSAKKESIDTFRKTVKIVNESLSQLIAEDEEGKAKAITAASDIVNDYTSWMQRVGQYQTKAMVELSDAIRADFGAQQAEQFKSSVAPALEATLATLMAQREAISNAVAVLAGEETAMEPMGAEPGAEAPVEPGMEPAAPDMMNEPEAGDEFAASDAAAGAGTTGREMRESRFSKKLSESHSIISKLAR